MKTQSNTTKTGKQIVRQQIKLGSGDVRTVRFVRGPKQVTVTGKGLPKLTIKGSGDDGYTAVCTNAKGKKVESVGRTPELAFKHAVTANWKH